MKQELNMGVLDLVERARSRIEEVEPKQAIAMLNQEKVLVVDIRDVRERQRDGFIPGSFHCPRGMAEFWADPNSPYFKTVFEENDKFLFHCAVDWRSALTVDTLTQMGFRGAAHIKGGLKAWKETGGPIQTDTPDKD
ncbi:MAG: rhodanese-like domain-containing protein [Burkholderiaceae bacterium]